MGIYCTCPKPLQILYSLQVALISATALAYNTSELGLTMSLNVLSSYNPFFKETWKLPAWLQSIREALLVYAMIDYIHAIGLASSIIISLSPCKDCFAFLELARVFTWKS